MVSNKKTYQIRIKKNKKVNDLWEANCLYSQDSDCVTQINGVEFSCVSNTIEEKFAGNIIELNCWLSDIAIEYIRRPIIASKHNGNMIGFDGSFISENAAWENAVSELGLPGKLFQWRITGARNCDKILPWENILVARDKLVAKKEAKKVVITINLDFLKRLARFIAKYKDVENKKTAAFAVFSIYRKAKKSYDKKIYEIKLSSTQYAAIKMI